MTTVSKHHTTRLSSITQMKGLAIVAVIVLHILSSMQPMTFTTSTWQPFYVALDQTLRFCVPMFVALSGYALSKKYLKVPFELGSFLSRRVLKLLPLYLFWSFLLMAVLWFVPAWRLDGEAFSIVNKLLLGKADYQLYFVPMLFQLYLLFPLLNFLMKRPKGEWGLLVATYVVQAAVILFFTWALERRETFPKDTWFITDQKQYLLSLSWVGYFGLGMWLGRHEQLFHKNVLLKLVAVAALVGSWWWTVGSAREAIASGVDPLFALRFTKLPIIVFGTSAIITLITVRRVFELLPSLLGKVLQWCGAQSYLLFLSHTLLLRLYFSRKDILAGELSWIEWGAALGIWIVAFVISLKWGSE